MLSWKTQKETREEKGDHERVYNNDEETGGKKLKVRERNIDL